MSETENSFDSEVDPQGASSTDPAAIPGIMDDPPCSTRWVFWLILGAFSVFFAEVTVGSSMFAFFERLSFFATFPLYTLHILVLSTIVLRFGRPTFASLFFAGVLFGLYEAYITKVLWSPPWKPDAWSIAGIAVLESMLLVLFWHVLMAFIVPLTVAEGLLTSSSRVRGMLNHRLRQWMSTKGFVLVFAAICGVLQSANSPSMLHTVASTISTSALILVLILLWTKFIRGQEYSLSQLLPRDRELVVLVVLLAALYVGMGFSLRREVIPAVALQTVVWAIYALFFFLLWLSLKRASAEPTSESSGASAPLSWHHWLLFSVVFVLVSSAAQPVVKTLGDAVFAVLSFGGVAFGWALLIASLLQVFRPRE